RFLWFLPAARWYARLSLACRPRVVTPWESCSHGSQTMTRSSRSPATANAPWTHRPTRRCQPRPERTRREMGSVAERLQRKSQRQVAVKQVRLKLVYIDFWSAVKLSFLVAVSLGIVLVVAAILVWIVLNSTGIFGSLDAILQDILDPEFRIAEVLSLGQVALF